MDREDPRLEAENEAKIKAAEEALRGGTDPARIRGQSQAAEDARLKAEDDVQAYPRHEAAEQAA